MKESDKRFFFIIVVLLICLFVTPSISLAQPIPIPRITIGVEEAETPNQVAITLQILLLLTIIALAPALLVMLTSFTRIVVVMHFLRQAMGTQTMPPNQIVVGLSLFLTFFIMSPVWEQINSEALQPYLEDEIKLREAYEEALVPIRKFLFKQTREKDIALFIKLAKVERPRDRDDVPNRVLIPAFIVSELKTAFEISFLIYLPFLVIDMVVASVLLSMGMLMLPPILISLPFKLMLFVLADGWHLLVGSIVKGFG